MHDARIKVSAKILCLPIRLAELESSRLETLPLSIVAAKKSHRAQFLLAIFLWQYANESQSAQACYPPKDAARGRA